MGPGLVTGLPQQSSWALKLSVRLRDNSSIFTAEAKAVLIALPHVAMISNSKQKHFIIYSDFLSCLTAI